MRLPRFKAPESHPVAYYHCVSRVVDRQFVFGDVEREVFLQLMREYEAFCGVRVITYSLMSNHFHILVEVPRRPKTLPTAEEILEKLRHLTCSGISVRGVQLEIEKFRASGDSDGEQAFLAPFYARMWDVSQFMKFVKQRYTQWHNRIHKRAGTLWESRFTSVLVDGTGEALITMAAYIDLNPVRAGLVSDPKDYRWCGYAEAVAGQQGAIQGIQSVAAAMSHQPESELEALRLYRLRLFGQGEQKEGFDEQGSPLRKGFDRNTVLQVIANKGSLPPAEYIRCRVRYFSDGRILGTRRFVDELFQEFRHRFSAQRKDGARKMRGLKSDLFTVRDLQKQVFE